MPTPKTNFARRGGKIGGGKVYNSQRATSDSPLRNRSQLTGAGLGKGLANRYVKRKQPKDTIMGVPKGDLRRLARRGGVKRISAQVYDTAGFYLREFVTDVCWWSKILLIVACSRLHGIRGTWETQNCPCYGCYLCSSKEGASYLWI
jgi:hypothetical protein